MQEEQLLMVLNLLDDVFQMGLNHLQVVFAVSLEDDIKMEELKWREE